MRPAYGERARSAHRRPAGPSTAGPPDACPVHRGEGSAVRLPDARPALPPGAAQWAA
ncbi:Hypothetical protein SCLAV_1252 [Streptomyces clavuligerus]|uniref:Uncharacterized protein n=1 Tax=Streptomyces clavuligerus TaxID=1901 RepID=E2PZM2_STRCL|nr:Hypothetical protein SCLAV_1252 [Streptomyces clavuligerus]